MIPLNGRSNGPAPLLRPKMTKILATLGPASMRPEAMRALLNAGANAFRLNCSHSSMKELEDIVKLIRRTSEKAKIPCSIVMDLQGGAAEPDADAEAGAGAPPSP